MTVTAPSVYSNTLPSAADPVTFDARMAALMEFITQTFGPQFVTATGQINADFTAMNATAASAIAAAAAAAASFDSFDDIYLGPKATAPTLDNDGNALVQGMLYFNTVGQTLWVRGTSSWLALAVQNLASLGITAAAAQLNPLSGAFDNAFLGAGMTSNLAIGAADFGNNARWMGAQSQNGVTCTRVGFGIDTDGRTYIDYSLSGPAAPTWAIPIYVQQNSVTPAVVGQVFTASVHAQIIAGTPPTNTDTGVRVEMRGQNTSGVETEAYFTDVTRPTVQTLRTLTATLANAATAQITCGVVLRVQSGVPVDFTVRIKGLQFDRGPSRLAYPFKPLSPTEARVAMGVEGNLVAPGIIGHCAMQTPPAGWLVRNGAAYSRTVYAALFAAIGTTYGVGDGSTTFNVPDDRSNFDRGWDGGRGIDVGRVFGSEQSDAIRNISGSLSFGAQMAPVQAVSGAFSSGTTNQFMPQQSTANTQGIGIVNFNASGSVPTAGENRPRNRAYLPIIKF